MIKSSTYMPRTIAGQYGLFLLSRAQIAAAIHPQILDWFTPRQLTSCTGAKTFPRIRSILSPIFIFFKRNFPISTKKLQKQKSIPSQHRVMLLCYVEVRQRKPFFGCIKTMKIWNYLMIPNQALYCTTIVSKPYSNQVC